MKNKIITSLIFCICFSLRVFSQDTTHTTSYDKDTLTLVHQGNTKVTFTNNTDTDKDNTKPVYRDTRLGSSSKMYNTYKKNDYGAGAITTNPKK